MAAPIDNCETNKVICDMECGSEWCEDCVDGYWGNSCGACNINLNCAPGKTRCF